MYNENISNEPITIIFFNNEDSTIKILTMLIISNNNKAKSKAKPNLKPNLIPLAINATPKANIVTKMLAVPTKALLTIPGSIPDFLYPKITPRVVEKSENIINFNHGGIEINAKIKIMTNAAIYAPRIFILNFFFSSDLSCYFRLLLQPCTVC